MATLSHIAIFCNDLNEMEKFYQNIFSMRTAWKNDDKAYLTTGNSDIFALLRKQGYKNREYDLEEVIKDPNTTPNFPHFGFVINSEDEFNDLMERVRLFRIKVIGPKVSRDKTKSFYFLDIENNPVQVVYLQREYFYGDGW